METASFYCNMKFLQQVYFGDFAYLNYSGLIHVWATIFMSRYVHYNYYPHHFNLICDFF